MDQQLVYQKVHSYVERVITSDDCVDLVLAILQRNLWEYNNVAAYTQERDSCDNWSDFVAFNVHDPIAHWCWIRANGKQDTNHLFMQFTCRLPLLLCVSIKDQISISAYLSKWCSSFVASLHVTSGGTNKKKKISLMFQRCCLSCRNGQDINRAQFPSKRHKALTTFSVCRTCLKRHRSNWLHMPSNLHSDTSSGPTCEMCRRLQSTFVHDPSNEHLPQTPSWCFAGHLAQRQVSPKRHISTARSSHDSHICASWSRSGGNVPSSSALKRWPSTTT